VPATIHTRAHGPAGAPQATTRPFGYVLVAATDAVDWYLFRAYATAGRDHLGRPSAPAAEPPSRIGARPVEG
jgi:hypothetical protein